MMQENRNYLAIYQNFKQTIDELPEKKRGNAWKLLIDFAFGESIDLDSQDTLTRMAIKSIMPLIKLRKISGVKEGTINNPNGKNQHKNNDNKVDNNEDNNNQNKEDNSRIIPLIKENKKKEKEYKYYGEVIKLDGDDWDKWKKRYPDLDLNYCLGRIDVWFQQHLDQKPRWFFMTQNMLAKEQKEVADKKTFMGRG